MRSKYMATVA
jgi:hypothetical protein